MEQRYRRLGVDSVRQLIGDYLLCFSKALFKRFYFAVRVTRVELLEEFSVYNYTLEYITTYLLGKSLENRIRFLKGYSILYIQVPLATECSKGLL